MATQPTAIVLFEQLPRVSPGRHGVPAEEVARRQRLLVLEAALLELGTHGYAGSAVDGICRRARVSRRTVYEQFPDRAAVMTAAVEHVVDLVADAVTAAWQEDGPRPALEQLLQTIAAEPVIARAVLIEVIGMPGGWELRHRLIVRHLRDVPDGWAALGALEHVSDMVATGHASKVSGLLDQILELVEVDRG